VNLTESNISKTLRQIAIPVSIGMFFHTMYNIVDTYFAGKISTDAQAALTFSFPLFFIIISMSAGLSQGLAALLSNYLGANNKEMGRLVIFQALTLGIIISIILSILGYCLTPFVFSKMGAENNFLSLSIVYMRTLFSGSIFFIIQNIFNAILTSSGKTKPFRNILIFSFDLNIFLDPLFMYGYWIVPRMGIQGLAVATIITQAIGCFIMFLYVKKETIWNQIKFENFIPNRNIIKELLRQGIPITLNMLTISFGIFIITYFIGIYGKFGVAAYGIASRIEQIAMLPAIGLNSAVLILVGQNNGAEKYERVKRIWMVAIFYGMVIIVIGASLIYLSAPYIMIFFTLEDEVIKIGAQYLKISAFVLPAYILIFITTSMLQGIKRPRVIMWIGIARQILVPILAYSLISIYFKLDLNIIWYALLITQWIACAVSLIYGAIVLNKISS